MRVTRAMPGAKAMRDGEQRIDAALAERADDQQRQQQARDRHDRVDRAHDRLVRSGRRDRPRPCRCTAPASVPIERRRDGQRHGGARADQQAAQHVAAELVGAEPVLRSRAARSGRAKSISSGS